MKNKKTKSNLNYFNKILIILLVLTLILYIIFINLNKIILTQPKDNSITTERYPEFKWNSKQSDYYKLIVDDSIDFKTPIINVITTEKNYKPDIKLDLTKYYWKVISENTASNVNSFTMNSVVAIELDNSLIKNVGNVRTKVTIEDRVNVIGAHILDINEFFETKKDQNLFKAEQDE